MKNKKSKIIVPALGLILLSTAASISGSVAWFTASRSATVNTGSFAVVKTDGILDSTLVAGVGTSISSNTANPVTGAKIADVSYDPVNKQLYTDKGDGGDSGYRALGNATSHSTAESEGTHAWKINNTTYYAFSWKVRLSYTWSADLTALNVYFDYAGSSVTAHTKQEGESSTANKTETGIRFAFIGASHTCVWAALQDVANLSGVYGTATGNVAAYGVDSLQSTSYGYFGKDKFAVGNLAAGSATAKASYNKAVDGDTNSQQLARADYLGTISYSTTVNYDNVAKANYTDVWCVAWFEGTDPNVVNDNELDEVTSQIKFYAVTAGN